ncbi:putative Carboxylesterase 5A [Hypsibius exemplaris]|uniref:Carboxylesterase 5A n=1 Tax=Hypsibius exemplaris TaxID=2072580 RepID=A0A1W0WBW5_HYPEX|nr:putative Carboxylesterase 5A [Hypsibius exemplaris]
MFAAMLKLQAFTTALLLGNVLADVVPVGPTVIAGLFNGLIRLPDDLELHGDQYWRSSNDEYRAFAYYGNHSYMKDPHRPNLGHVCPQLPFQLPALNVFHRNLRMNEDCLYLDVYLPPVKPKQNHTWPVLFWIYGGGFVMGDKDLYNGSILARAVDAIVVTVNYRLEAFGFLSTGDESASGNWAIGDLKLALNWTRQNIAFFNGDPTKLTIFGESAGGILVSALMLDEDVRSIDGIHIQKEPRQLLEERSAESLLSSFAVTYLNGHLRDEYTFFTFGSSDLNGTFDMAKVRRLMALQFLTLGHNCRNHIVVDLVEKAWAFYNVSESGTSDELRHAADELSHQVH